MSTNPMKGSQRLMLGLIGVLLMLAAYNLLWSVFRSPALLTRDDNPRLVFASQRIQRGDILDRNDVAMATSRYANGLFFREYPSLGTAPLTGYASFNYGTSGLENTFDALLTSADLQDEQTLLWQREVLYEPQVGRAIRTTIDTTLQVALAQTNISAAIVIDRNSGDLLAIVSNPSYDANTLDADWETITENDQGALVNRGTQIAYPTGDLLKTLLHLNRLNLTKDGSYLPNQVQFLNFLDEFGIFRAQPLDIEHTDSHIALMRTDLEQTDIANWDGQMLKLTPLQIATILRTISNQGVRSDVRLVSETQANSIDEWVPQRFNRNELVVLPRAVVNSFREEFQAQSAAALQLSMTDFVDNTVVSWVAGETQNRELIWVVVSEENDKAQIESAMATIEAFASTE